MGDCTACNRVLLVVIGSRSRIIGNGTLLVRFSVQSLRKAPFVSDVVLGSVLGRSMRLDLCWLYKNTLTHQLFGLFCQKGIQMALFFAGLRLLGVEVRVVVVALEADLGPHLVRLQRSCLLQCGHRLAQLVLELSIVMRVLKRFLLVLVNNVHFLVNI